MKRLPEIHLTFQPLARMLYGSVQSKLLLAGIELKVFSHLVEPMDASSLASRLQTDPVATPGFLDSLAANDLLCKRDGLYSNAPLAETFLVEGKPTYIGHVIADNAEWMQSSLDALTVLVREGPSAVKSRPHSIDWTQEVEIRGNCQRSGFAQYVVEVVRRLPEFPRLEKMLDLGCGAGLMGLGIVAAHPTLTGVLFDKADVVEVAQRFIREYEMEDRVSTLAGDYYQDSIGEGYDLVWTSYTLSKGKLDRILPRIRAALRPGGVHMNLSGGVTDERTRPTEAINAFLHHNLTSRDAMTEEGEMAQAMLRAGFRSVHSRRAEAVDFHGPGLIDIARI